MAIAAEIAARLRFSEEFTNIGFLPFSVSLGFAVPGREYSRIVPIPEKGGSCFGVGEYGEEMRQ